MDKLLEKASKFLEDNLFLNEVELSDGVNRVKVTRNMPVVWYYYYPQPNYQYSYQQPAVKPM